MGRATADATLGRLRAVHRERPGPGRGVRPVRGRAGRPVPGHRRALPGLRRGRRAGRADRLVADHQGGRPGLGRLAGLRRRRRGGDPRLRDPLRPGPGQKGSPGQGGSHHRADAHPVRPDGPALDDQRRPGPLAHAAHRQRRLHGGPDPGDLDAGDRAGGRRGAHRGHRRVPAVHQARHGHAGDGQRPRYHRDPGRAGEKGGGRRLAGLRRAGRRGRAAAGRPGRARRHHAHLPGDLVPGGGADRPAALDHGHVHRRDRDRPAARPADSDHRAHQLPRHDPVRDRRRGAADPVAAPGHGAIPRGGLVSEPKGRGVVWTEERGTSDEGRRRLKAPRRRASGEMAVIAVLLAFVLFGLPQLMSLYYIDTMTQVAVYSMVALGLGVLVGRVGLVSLGQVAVLAIGAWVAARLLFATALPYPVVMLAAGVITMALGTLRGLYLALITLMLAGAITVVLATANFPNGGHGFLGYNGSSVHIPPIRRPSIAASDPAYFRYSVVVAALMFLLVLMHIRTRPGRA